MDSPVLPSPCLARLALSLLLLAASRETALSQLVEGDCDSCVITRTEAYEGAALAGYMNGGAELYREYGFVRLTVQEVRLPDGEDLTAEIYLMTNPSASCGIFSISRHECGNRDTAFTYSCSGPYQIQCAAGPWFVRVMNGTGSPGAQAASRTLLRTFVLRTGQPRVSLSPLFSTPLTSSARDEMILAAGPLGVQNGLPDWSDILDGFTGFTLRAVRLHDDRGILAELVLAHEEDGARVARGLGIPVAMGSVLTTTKGLRGYAMWRSPVRLRILETTASAPAVDSLLSVLASAGE
jgi:hypothetical protein